MQNKHTLERVIFLDHDDVICLVNDWGSRNSKMKKYRKQVLLRDRTEPPPVYYRFDHFDRKAVSVLNDILELTGAEIVVTSTWRAAATLEEMQKYYQHYHIAKPPIDYTPDMQAELTGTEYDTQQGSDDSILRVLEINKYLELHPQIEHWVAVDDLELQGDPMHHVPNFVRIEDPREGIKKRGVKERILAFFPSTE